MKMDTGEYVALIAVIISFVSLYRTRKQKEIENRFNQLSSKIAEIQLQKLEKEKKENNSADMTAYFYKDYKDNYRIAISNIGAVPGTDVTLEIGHAEGGRSPLIESDAKSKLPVKILHPDTEVHLLLAISMGMPTSYDVILSWKNPDGQKVEKSLVLSLCG